MDTAPVPQAEIRCISCNAKLKGKYCHRCGEKKIEPDKDYDLLAFARENLEHFLKLDAKLLRTFTAFFTRPGFLTLAFLEGRRKAYMKPLALFLTVAVVVYVLLPTTNVYFETCFNLKQGFQHYRWESNIFQVNIAPLLEDRARQHQMPPEQVDALVFREAWTNSKTFLFLIPPVWALFLWLFLFDRNRFYVPHLIFALHSFAFFMAIDLIFLEIMHHIVHANGVGDLMFLPLFVAFCLYLWLALQRVYGPLRPLSMLLRSLGILMALILVIVLYRQLITIGTIWRL